MELGRAIKGLIADWSAVLRKAFKGFLATTIRIVAVLAVLGGILSIPHLVWPQIDIKMTAVNVAQSDGRLNRVSFDLENGSYLDLKDPDIACDMKGTSGTTIKTTSKIIYEVIPAESKRPFVALDMGEIPEQANQFNCYVKGASVKW